METSELRDFLLENNRSVMNWEDLMETLKPKVLEIHHQRVYMFDMIFDITNKPVDDQLVISLNRPAEIVPLHVHPYIELVYVYQGQCTVEVNGQQIRLNEGGIILINKMTPHTVLETGYDDIVIDIKLRHDYLSAVFLNRLTSKSIISEFLVNSLIDKRRTSPCLHFRLEGVTKTGQILAQLMCEYFDRGVCSHDIINSYLTILFTERIRHPNHSDSALPKGSRDEVTIIQFLQYIEEHYRDCTLVEMAEHFNFHPNALSALLKKATGKSFKDLLQMQRLNKAALYLKNTDMSIEDISDEVGYASLSFFHKKFKEVFGETPRHYREHQNR
jgi:AraC family transcriptional regulator, melibiose operon regulatory protein